MMWVVHDTNVSNLTHQNRTIHRCVPASAHNIYRKVAMVTILGAHLGLFAVIRVSKEHTHNYFHLQDVFTALMIACNQQLIVRCFGVASEMIRGLKCRQTRLLKE